MGDTTGASNPDIQLLVDPLLCHTLHPAIAHTEEECIVDSAWETGGEKEGESQKCGARHGETQREGQTDHESVMEPVIESEGGTVDPDMIEVKCKTEVGREPVGLIAIEVFKICHGGPEIGRSDGDNQCIMDGVDRIVGILELVSLEERIHEHEGLEKGGRKQERD